ncbi:hypothetical protein T11_17970 [Trichinella zimbabwensis]|uniref:Uncharacterized protein n=1 Tax=Trichinella zimbabwensis TaxID=268475 RepID=A0A0V1I4M5_9BILA|nr:hypothetical protein T11_17970 [Trichinella zimbabwensis]
MYFRAARIAPERQAALVQYHTDAEVQGIMRAMHVQETDDYDILKSALFEAFRVRTGSERFSAEFFWRKQQRSVPQDVRISRQSPAATVQRTLCGRRQAADWRSETHSFAEAIEVPAKDERVVREFTTLKVSVTSVKTDAHPEDEQPAGMATEATVAAVMTRKEVGKDLAEVVRQLKELLTGNTPAATKRSLPQR